MARTKSAGYSASIQEAESAMHAISVESVGQAWSSFAHQPRVDPFLARLQYLPAIVLSPDRAISLQREGDALGYHSGSM